MKKDGNYSEPNPCSVKYNSYSVLVGSCPYMLDGGRGNCETALRTVDASS